MAGYTRHAHLMHSMMGLCGADAPCVWATLPARQTSYRFPSAPSVRSKRSVNCSIADGTPAGASDQATFERIPIRSSFFPASAKISSASVICWSSCAAETETRSSDSEFGVAGGIAMLV